MLRTLVIDCTRQQTAATSCNRCILNCFSLKSRSSSSSSSSSGSNSSSISSTDSISNSSRVKKEASALDSYFQSRDWKLVVDFYRSLVTKAHDPTLLPLAIRGSRSGELKIIEKDSGGNEDQAPSYFGLGNVAALGGVFRGGEMSSLSPRARKKKTYAIRMGYVGSEFSGFQSQSQLQDYNMQQKGNGAIYVESELSNILGHKVICCGRTDKHVSAISQIVHFSSPLDLDCAKLLAQLNESPLCLQGKMRFYECDRVPSSFNARSSATWRRYIYLLPLTRDASVSSSWSSNLATELSIFARTSHLSSKDGDININQINRSIGSSSSSSNGEGGDSKSRLDPYLGFDLDLQLDVPFIREAFKRVVGSKLNYNAFAFGEDRDGNSTCCLVHSDVKIMHLNPKTNELIEPSSGSSGNDSIAERGTLKPVLMIELCGDRFLRQMVRKLVSSVLKASLTRARSSAHNLIFHNNSHNKPSSFENSHQPFGASGEEDSGSCEGANGERDFGSEDEYVISRICLANKRHIAEYPGPGQGLLLAGVGYNYFKLADYYHMKKTDQIRLKAMGAAEFERLLMSHRLAKSEDYCA